MTPTKNFLRLPQGTAGRVVGALVLSCGVLLVPACAEGVPADAAMEGGKSDEVDPVSAPLADGPTRSARAAEGVWLPAASGGSRSIVFSAASTPLVAIACDDRGGLVLRHWPSEPAAKVRMLKVEYGGISSLLAANPVGGNRGVLQVIIPYNDPLVARMAEGPATLVVDTGRSGPAHLPKSGLVRSLAVTCGAARTGGTIQQQT